MGASKNAGVPFLLWCSYAVVAAIAVGPGILNRRVNGDLLWQRWLGEQILHAHRIPNHIGWETLSAVGAKWVPQEWLLGILLVLLPYGVLVAASVGAVVAAMMFGTARAAHRGANPIFLGLCAIVIGLALLGPFGVRAQVFAWPFFALLLVLLDDGRNRIWWTIPLVAVWSNVHASVIIAPVAAGLYAFGALLDARMWSGRVTRYAVLSVFLALAACANPFGWHLPAYAFALAQSPIRSFIGEWQPIGLGDYGLWVVVLPLCLGLAVLAVKKQRLPWSDVLIILLTGYLAATAVRDIPLFALAAAPIVCGWIGAMFPPPRALPERAGERIAQIACACVVLPVLGWLSFSWFGTAYARGGVLLPAQAMTYLAALPGDKRVFCYDFSDCGLALGDARIRTFMDGRCDPFPWPVWQQYRVILRGKPGWQEILRRYGVTLVVTPRGALLNGPLEASSAWSRIYRKDGFDIFEARTTGGRRLR